MPLKELLGLYLDLKKVFWVISPASKHLDWNKLSEGQHGKPDIAVWHDIINEMVSDPSPELPTSDPEPQDPNTILVSEPGERLEVYEIIEFTQKVRAPHSIPHLKSPPRTISLKNHRLRHLRPSYRLSPPAPPLPNRPPPTPPTPHKNLPLNLNPRRPLLQRLPCPHRRHRLKRELQLRIPRPHFRHHHIRRPNVPPEIWGEEEDEGESGRETRR